MALLFADGFDHYATADITTKWTAETGAWAISSGNGRNSTSSLRLTNFSSAACSKSFSPNTNTLIVGFGLRAGSFSGTSWAACAVNDGGTFQCGLFVNSTGNLFISNGSVLGTGQALSANAYYYIEMKVLIHASAGTFEVRVNGVTDPNLNLTGIDTQQSANARWTTLILANRGFGNDLHNIDWDDFYVCDNTGSVNNDFLGPIRIVTLFPDGAGNSTDFTPSAGSNFQNVDDTTPDSDTTYNSEATPGDHDTYTFGAVGVTGTVKGVQTNLMVRSDGAGSETIAPVIRSGGTDYDGTTVGVTTTYAYASEVFEENPDTSAAWTVSEIDAAEFGIKLVS